MVDNIEKTRLTRRSGLKPTTVIVCNRGGSAGRLVFFIALK